MRDQQQIETIQWQGRVIELRYLPQLVKCF